MCIPKAFVKVEVTLAASLIQCKRNCTSNGNANMCVYTPDNNNNKSPDGKIE